VVETVETEPVSADIPCSEGKYREIHMIQAPGMRRSA
jgi:hypothetical protein